MQRVVDNELDEARRKRDNAYATAVIQSNSQNWKKYRRARNCFLFLLRAKKKVYMEKKLNDANGNLKETWKILKTLLKGKNNNKIKEVEINGELVSGDREMAQKMNEFYVNSVVNINNSIGVSSITANHTVTPQSQFDFKNVNIRYIKDCLHEMKKQKRYRLYHSINIY